MDELLKSVRTPQEAIEFYQKVQNLLSKGGFTSTKLITSDDEVKSQITEADRSTKVVKTFEFEPHSSSKLGLNWNADTDNPIVCRATEQEVSAKNNSESCPILCLSNVRPTWYMLTLHHKNAVSTQKQLGSNGKSMGQKDVSRTRKTIEWLVLWIERNKDYINKSISFRKRTQNLETTLFHRCIRSSNVPRGISARWSSVEAFVIEKCRVAPIRHTTILKLELQAAVYGVRPRRQILREHDGRIDKTYYWTNSSTVLQRLQSAHKKQQVFLADRAAEIRENSSVDRRRHVKGIENPANIGTGGMPIECLKEHGWLKGPAWLQTDEEKWPKPWCQVNEVKAEQATITVATETELDQLINWRQYWSFNRFRKFTAHCMRFKTKQKGASKQTKCIKQNEYRFDLFKSEASRMFQSP